MPTKLITPFALVVVARDGAVAPPYVSETRSVGDRDAVERAALDWARTTYGDGNWTVVAGAIVTPMQASKWGTWPF